MAFSLTLSGTDRVALLLTIVVILLLYSRSRQSSCPPGPRKLPLIGNLLDIPSSSAWETYKRWGKQFSGPRFLPLDFDAFNQVNTSDSDIIHLHAAGKDIIVLNSFEAANELLDKRSSIYSSRPHFPMLGDLMGWNWLVSVLPYGKRWRERRRLFQQYFSNRNTEAHRAQQVEVVYKALFRLMNKPDGFFDIVRQATSELAISLACGLKLQDSDDPFLGMAERAFKSAGDAAIPGAFLVDVFPWLKYVPEWVPGAGFQKKAKAWRKLQEDFRELPYAEAVKNLVSGRTQPSLISKAFESLDNSSDREHQEEVIKDTAGGTETTETAFKTFLVAMLYHPDAQRKAQEELDKVLGGRLPEFHDEAQLPFISALIKEVFRWKPVVPIVLPHVNTQDDVYEGYLIPRGSLVLANAWAMLHDEEEYPDPASFRPERFLMSDGKLDPGIRDPSSVAFGFGRRKCPGANIAMSTLWFWIASFLTVFNISNALDEDGLQLEPSVEYASGALTYHPKPFKCRIKPRSKAAEELIRSRFLSSA